VVGEKEASAGTVNVRKRSGGEQVSLPVEEFLAQARQLSSSRALTL